MTKTTIKTAKRPLVGFAAYSGTGKTTLLKNIIPLLKSRGFSVGVVKHAHHTFEVDEPGKDSYELRKSGADQMLIGSKYRWALMADNQGDDLTLEDHVGHLCQDELDIILVEGFKPAKIPKIELFRPSLGNDPFYPDDDTIIAIATDGNLPVETKLPVIDLNNAESITEFIIEHYQL